MDIKQVHEVFRKIASGERHHGSFMTTFATALMEADHDNEVILQPAALALIEKYPALNGYAMTAEDKKWIDEATYEQLLSRWRNGPFGDSMFQGETGEYYSKVMKERRAQPGGNDEHVRASKNIG